MVIAFLMWKERLTFNEAFAQVGGL